MQRGAWELRKRKSTLVVTLTKRPPKTAQFQNASRRGRSPRHRAFGFSIFQIWDRTWPCVKRRKAIAAKDSHGQGGFRQGFGRTPWFPRTEGIRPRWVATWGGWHPKDRNPPFRAVLDARTRHLHDHSPRPLGHRERCALATLRLVQQRCRAQPQGSRPCPHRHPSPPRPRSRTQVHIQGVPLDSSFKCNV